MFTSRLFIGQLSVPVAHIKRCWDAWTDARTVMLLYYGNHLCTMGTYTSAVHDTKLSWFTRAVLQKQRHQQNSSGHLSRNNFIPHQSVFTIFSYAMRGLPLTVSWPSAEYSAYYCLPLTPDNVGVCKGPIITQLLTCSCLVLTVSLKADCMTAQFRWLCSPTARTSHLSNYDRKPIISFH